MPSRYPIGKGSKPALTGKTLYRLQPRPWPGNLTICKVSSISSQLAAKTKIQVNLMHNGRLCPQL
jgi:hypothetical protein